MSENATNLNRQGAEIIPEVWSMSLSKKLDKSGVGMKIVNKVYEQDTSHYGDTVNIGEIGDVNVVDYSEDVETGGVTYQRVDTKNQQLKLDQSKAFGVFISDITMRQSGQQDLQRKFEERAKTAIDLAKDTYILSAFSEIPEENKLTDVTLTPDNAINVWYGSLKHLKTTMQFSKQMIRYLKLIRQEQVRLCLMLL